MSVSDKPLPVVTGPFGSVAGSLCRSGAARFFGIPYAAPPTGPLRWRPPQAAPVWSGIRLGLKPAPRCIQHAPYGELEPDNSSFSEDCLYLNIWTPALVNAALPVIFWVHGGEFFAGSGTEPRYDGESLAARGAVVVTVNYRLGVFGFLSHPALSEEGGFRSSGNYGLLDVIAALEWVRANIECFGGNPGNVTLAGQSAGSCMVGAFLTMPLARGLFHRGIGESCAYFMPEAHAMRPLSLAENEERGREFQSAAGVSSLADLRAMDGRALLEAWLKNESKRMQPCIDGHVLPMAVDAAYAWSRHASLPLLAGWTAEEAGFLQAAAFDAAAFRATIARRFEAGADELWQAYSSAAQHPLSAAIALTSDRMMVYPTWKWVDHHARSAPVFAYRFERAPPESTWGASHASEIEYVFGTLDSRPSAWQHEDRVLSLQMGDYWVNFARTGDPNGSGLPHWPQYCSAGPPVVMRLGADVRSDALPGRDLLLLLDALYEGLRARTASSAR